MRAVLVFLVPLAVAALPGCGGPSAGSKEDTGRRPVVIDNGHDDEKPDDEIDEYAKLYDVDIDFFDDRTSNARLDEGLTDLVLVDKLGIEHEVAEYAEGRNLVLVVTRGNTTPICPYCSAQTAHYITRYREFVDRDTEVLLAYPVELERHRDKLKPFLDQVKTRLDDPDRSIPFPVLFDVELKAVDRLGIRKDLSKPATYILDREGRMRYGYVGRDRADRPSVDAILKELDKLEPAPVNEEPGVDDADANSSSETSVEGDMVNDIAAHGGGDDSLEPKMP